MFYYTIILFTLGVSYLLRKYAVTWYFLISRKSLHWYLFKLGREKQGNYYLSLYPGKQLPVIVSANDIKNLHSQRVNKLWRIQELSKAINACGGDKGLFTAEGKDWQKQRGICSRAFNDSFLSGIHSDFLKVAERAVDWLKAEPVQNLLDFSEKLSLDCICLAILGFDLNSVQQESKSLQHFHNLNVGLEMLFSSAFKPLHGDAQQKMNSAIEHVKGIILANLDTQDTFASNFLMNNASEEEVLGNLMTFLFAGHDTTKASLVWTLYCLLQNPTAADKIRQEVQELKQRTPTSMANLKFALACFNEAIRLYPPAAFNVFQASTSFKYNDISLEKDNVMFLSYLNSHYNEDYYSKATEFIPQRWLTPQKIDPKVNYFGFGFGPRICPGKQLAQAEVSIILGTLFDYFTIEKVSGFDYSKVQYENKVIAGPTRIDGCFVQRNNNL